MWMWSAVLPFCWSLAIALRVLGWQICLFNRDVYRRTVDAAVQRWWGRRRLGLPVEQVLLLGPVGDEQTHYHGLMAGVPAPKPSKPEGEAHPMLRCAVSLGTTAERAPALARRLARLTLALTQLNDRWPQLRGIAWVGDERDQAAFVEVLAKTGVTLPETRLPLQDLSDLDRMIDAFHQDCCEEADWLLCAGVVSVPETEAPGLPGEAGFLWLVSRQGRQLLHRGEYLLSELDESPAELCSQIQRYAGLDAAPPDCLALDITSQGTFLKGGWQSGEHQLSGHWGVLAQLAPFIGMSLALLQASEARQPCGWLSQDGNNRLAIGMAVPHGND
ncbi:hypothetical protein HFK74_10420|uniref:hypothetical protein n=1 Tax=Pseudomonas sp. SbOxS1 TaxID=2723884 RepID=UPI0015D2C874|nr:hypothetical protein [Pseudomonas sp. SbOxS1]NYU03113.1 hypothetical protein [Pseudomonas sp. SbOxS1]